MTSITAEMVRRIRQDTGAGVLLAKEALLEADGNFAKAKQALADKGFKISSRRRDATKKFGVVGSYIHTKGSVGAIVKLTCETEMVASMPAFKELAYSIAMQITAMNPKYIYREDAPEGTTGDKILVTQEYIKGDLRIEDLVREAIAKFGENIRIESFSRMEL